ncbi:hypothetical protein BO82DRAFT_195520 [Aspergillus uvarum CBS 121591]|uniref:Uncharacterized protein n=1 Tax=Aspergillus uvarum CBS 121591 TaxID=1448315 RepID=A0A319BSZ3_9EURO|nr:hypothetical protein BO82DRAFT_195520 [Aspergillus uvarum CBS 121591]PYH76706.1 hypothetical protein BO82DRAFT_195520 [Aspergillus uvarum CBS 121591]
MIWMQLHVQEFQRQRRYRLPHWDEYSMACHGCGEMLLNLPSFPSTAPSSSEGFPHPRNFLFWPVSPCALLQLHSILFLYFTFFPLFPPPHFALPLVVLGSGVRFAPASIAPLLYLCIIFHFFSFSISLPLRFLFIFSTATRFFFGFESSSRRQVATLLSYSSHPSSHYGPVNPLISPLKWPRPMANWSTRKVCSLRHSRSMFCLRPTNQPPVQSLPNSFSMATPLLRARRRNLAVVCDLENCLKLH